MKRFAVIVEPSATSFGAWVPDLPGCVAVGKTRGETLRLMREAISLHVESLRENGQPVPEPVTQIEYVNAPV